MSKTRWTLLTLSGIIFVVSVNVWAAKRDHKLLEAYTQSEEYNEYVRRKVWRPFLTDSSRNYKEESKTWKSFSQEETNYEQT